jgi:diaminobutyrate acetyltransferase
MFDHFVSARAPATRAITTGAVRYRLPTPSDGRAMWHLARSVGLDLNSPYAYVLWADHFSASSIVAEVDVAEVDEIVGFVTGFHPPRDPSTLFVWQIGVAPEARKRGIGGGMLDELLARSGARWLEATVTPSNTASAALFRGAAARHGAHVEGALVYPRELFAGDHEPEYRFRIGPLQHDTTVHLA